MSRKSKTGVENETVAILGMGYVGLPLALLFARKGVQVIGLDNNPERVEMITSGRSPIRYIESSRVRKALDSGNFRVTSDFSELKKATAVLICVPTPLTAQKEPDLSYVADAARLTAEHASSGVLVVLESTTYPGTTREVVITEFEKRGWKPGENVFFAYSPEREDPANASFHTENIPRLVGGYDARSLERALALYRSAVTEVIPMSSLETAEAAKLLENIFRCVNIAMVNELKMVFDRMGIDVWEVIKGASTKPFGFMPFYPGPGLGGHCIPIDPFYLTWKAREFDMPTKFIELAGEINTRMPYYVLSKVQEALNSKKMSIKGSRILLLGIAYKKDVNDLRESPALKLWELLQEQGAQVKYHDPCIPAFTGDLHYPNLKPTRSVALTAKNLKSFDAALIATNHSQVDYALVQKHIPLLIDTRNIIPPPARKSPAYFQA